MSDITPKLRELGILPPSKAEQAAAEIHKEHLVAFFNELARARELGRDPVMGARRATIAALAAVEALISGSAKELGAPFSRLRNTIERRASPPGGVIATDGDAVEADNREAVDFLKACGAYAVRLLAGRDYPFKRAAADVAMVFLSHNFPRGHYFEKNGKPKKTPTLSSTSKYLEGLSREYRTARLSRRRRVSAKAVTIRDRFMQLMARPPLGSLEGVEFSDKRAAVLDWLAGELARHGYAPNRNYLFY